MTKKLQPGIENVASDSGLSYSDPPIEIKSEVDTSGVNTRIDVDKNVLTQKLQPGLVAVAKDPNLSHTDPPVETSQQNKPDNSLDEFVELEEYVTRNNGVTGNKMERLNAQLMSMLVDDRYEHFS